jgi:hypothetical protein
VVEVAAGLTTSMARTATRLPTGVAEVPALSSDAMTDAPGREPAQQPPALLIAAVMLGLQGALLAIAGLVELVVALVGHPHDRGTAVLLGALSAFYGLVVLNSARGVARARPWALTPSLMIEFFALVIGIGQIHTIPGIAIPLIVTAVVAVAAMLHPQARRRLIRR